MKSKMEAYKNSKWRNLVAARSSLIRKRIKNWRYKCEKQLDENINLPIHTAINYEQINRNEKMAKVIFTI